MLGEDQPIILKLLEIEPMMKSLEGVVMELNDGAYPLLNSILATSDPYEAFRDSNYILLVGSKPRGKGQERSDVLMENAKIFSEQGKVINSVADPDCSILVVGNPANTNALILSSNAPDMDPNNISAMTRLDHDRGLAQIAEKCNVDILDIERFCIWGNHSSTQYPDVSNTLVKKQWFRNVVKDEEWINKTFIPTVQQRGAQIIEARGKSSAKSAANAAIAHVRDLVFGTNSQWTSMAVHSSGRKYGIPSGIWCSVPVVCSEGKYQIVNRIEFDEEGAKRLNASIKELLDEKQVVKGLLKDPVFRMTPYAKEQYFSWKYIYDTVSPHFIPSVLCHDELQKAIQTKLFKSLKLDHSLESLNSINTSTLNNVTLDFSDVKDLVKDFSKEDLEIFTSAVIRYMVYFVSIIQRKIKKIHFELEEIKMGISKDLSKDTPKSDLKNIIEKRVNADEKLSIHDGMSSLLFVKHEINKLVV
jgi:malate dehydrogenase